MRTRYLANEYFPNLRSPADPSPSPRCFPFPQLPGLDPLIDPSIPSPALSAFDLVHDLHLPSVIDRLPIDGALALFLADVVPRDLPVETAEADRLSPDRFPMRSMEGGCGYGDLEMEEERGILEFEVVETDFALRGNGASDAVDLGGSGMRISVDDMPMIDTITLERGSDIPYPHDMAKSPCTIEDILFEVDANEGNNHSRETAGLVNRNPANISKFLLFEVGEVGVHFGSGVSMKELFDCVLPSIKSCSEVQHDEALINLWEFVTPLNCDDLENLECIMPKEYVESKPICLSSLVEMDLTNLNDSILVEKGSALYPITSDGGTSPNPCFVQLQEMQMLDLSHSKVLEIFGTLQATSSQIPPQKVFKDDISSAGDLYETIISSELALRDEMFVSLPVPVIMYEKERISPSLIAHSVLNSMNPRPVSACESIYLDWHLTLDNACGQESCYVLMDMLLEVSAYRIDDVQYHGETSTVIDLDFLDDEPGGPAMLQGEEKASFNFDATNLHSDISPLIAGTENLGSKNASNLTSKKVSSLFQSMSQSNDLNYFINVRRGIPMQNSERSNKEKAHSGAAFPCKAPILATISEVNSKKWDIEALHVGLSDPCLALVDAIYKDYLQILANFSAKRDRSSSLPEDDGELHISNKKLNELIKRRTLNDSGAFQDDDMVTLLAIYGVRQLSYLLCAFGIRSAYLYVSNLCQGSEALKGKLRNVASLLEDALLDAKKQRVEESQPSLSMMEKILSGCQSGKKTLVVANEGFWMPLKLKLLSMKIMFQEVRVDKATLFHENIIDECEFSKSILEALKCSDCLLVSCEHVFASLPFSKFSIIVEYGDLRESSLIMSNFSPMEATLPRVFFLYIKLDDHGAAKALLEGFGTLEYPETRLGNGMGLPQFGTTAKANVSGQKIFQLLNFVPIEDKTDHIAASESKTKAENSLQSLPMVRMPGFADTNIINYGTRSFPDTVIIVNTQTSEKKTLMSRRSSYQKILVLEKEGVQVAERDVDLPVDLIFTAAICLVWYDANSLTKTRETADGYAYMSVFTENIATDVLMALSFAFKSCILVFEGETNFLAAVMDSSDTIYAAAASLDMCVQIFCSYSSETTDEIILNCIKRARSLFGGLYPPIPESETLAESFLTRFPSINPLSAHGILSSGGMLVDFLEWSHERRVQAIWKHQVPNESMVLFTALCKYAEHGESKSVMTECSSIDSEISSGIKHLRSKRQKYEANHIIDLETNEADELINLPHPRSQLLDDIMKPPNVCGFSGSRDDRDFLDTVKRVKSYDLLPTTESSGKKLRFDVSSDKVGLNFQTKQENLYTEFSGELVDFDCVQLNDDFPSISETINFSRKREVADRKHDTASRLEPHYRSQSLYPLSEDISQNNDVWPSQKDYKSILHDDTCKFSGSQSQGDPLNLKSKLPAPVHEIERKFLAFSHQGKIANKYGGRSSSSGNLTSRSRKGSPSTIDFINRMKVKAHTSKQNLTCNTCIDRTMGSGNHHRITKTRSPSIIDTFRYEGGNQSQPPIRGNRQIQQSTDSSRWDKASSCLAHPWTPVDKRARQKLSFMRNGNKKQSKLVWRNMNIPTTDCSLRKRYQGDT